MKVFKKITTISDDDILDVQRYLVQNSHRSVQDVYNHIKSIPVLKRSKTCNLVFTYLYINRKKLGIKC